MEKAYFKFKKFKSLQILFGVIVLLVFSVMCESLYTLHIHDLPKSSDAFGFYGIHTLRGQRTMLLFLFFAFIYLHIILDIKRLYDFIYRKRFVILAVVFVFAVLNQYHLSSYSMFDIYIQNGLGSEFVNPIFGRARSIRSDEWLANMPRILSGQYGSVPYGPINEILRGTETITAPYGCNFSYGSLAFPYMLGYSILGAFYGASVHFVGLLLLIFITSFEMCLILTKKDKLMSLAGAFLICFSAYNQWWSICSWIFALQACLVCLYNYLYAKNYKQKIILAVLIAICFANYVAHLYPAWQVPAGYFALCLVAWIIKDNWQQAKALRKMDWIIISVSFIFSISIIASFLWNSREYIEIINNTVYPGERSVSGGNLSFSPGAGSFYKLIIGSISDPLLQFLRSSFSNPSESATFFTLFPIPIIAMAWKMLKEKKIDWLGIAISGFSLALFSYCALGWPEFLAKITLMDKSTPGRSIDILSFAQTYLLIVVLSKSFKFRAGPVPGVLIAVFTAMLTAHLAAQSFTTPIPLSYVAVTSIGIFILGYYIFCNRKRTFHHIAFAYLIVFSIASGVTINPIMKGFDAIYSKPVAQEIQMLATDSKEKWVSIDGIIAQQFLISCGASTINSNNYYPNIELWNMLDPKREYEEVYNRYAHVVVKTTIDDTTSFTLANPDVIQINLTYKDFEKIGIKYIYVQNYTPDKLQPNNYVKFIPIYNEAGSSIFEAVYI